MDLELLPTGPTECPSCGFLPVLVMRCQVLTWNKTLGEKWTLVGEKGICSFGQKRTSWGGFVNLESGICSLFWSWGVVFRW